GAGEAEPKQGAAARRILGGDASAVSLGDLAHDCEAEPRARERARVGRAVEAVEHVLAVLGSDAGTVIADAKLAPRQSHLDARAGRRPLAGVLEQVPDGALEPLGDALDRGRLDVRVEMHVRKARTRAVDGALD